MASEFFPGIKEILRSAGPQQDPSGLVANLEPLARVRLSVGHFDPIDNRGWRAAAKPLDKLLNRRFLARKMRFHASVPAIAHPARDGELVGLLLRPCAKPDALHAAGHKDMTADASHHTTLMSGASSAFMPTTL